MVDMTYWVEKTRLPHAVLEYVYIFKIRVPVKPGRSSSVPPFGIAFELVRLELR
jgi:hypothetical protein